MTTDFADSTGLNKNSYISLGLAGLLIVATLWVKDGQSQSAKRAEDAVTATVAVQTELVHYKDMQKMTSDLLNTKIDNLGELLKQAGNDRFTGHDHKVFVQRLRELNPTLKVPEPSN